MGEQMNLEGAFLGEPFVTHGTPKGLLTGMGANMLVQLPFRGKESATIYTLVKASFTASSLV